MCTKIRGEEECDGVSLDRLQGGIITEDGLIYPTGEKEQCGRSSCDGTIEGYLVIDVDGELPCRRCMDEEREQRQREGNAMANVTKLTEDMDL